MTILASSAPEVRPVRESHPNLRSWELDAPNMFGRVDFDQHRYQEDIRRFRRMPRRRAFIRPLNKSLVGMMRSPNDLTPPMPWFLVLRPAVGWHLRVPFWQGPQPYSIEPETDAEAMTIFSEYCDRQGFRPTRELA